MKKPRLNIPVQMFGLTLLLTNGTLQAQQSIANPLIRPAIIQSTPAGVLQQGDGNVGAVSAQPAQSSEELMRQAERRVTQEDLNIRQQALNTPVVPVQLVNYFSNVQVTALLRGAVVLRRVEQFQGIPAVQTTPAAGGARDAAVPLADPRTASRSTGVLRLKAGQAVNVSGYQLRANVNGLEVTVDWLSDGGRWVNVFFGALESSHEPNSQTPEDSRLIKVDTEAYDYLVPALTTRTFSAGSTLGGQGNSASGGLGGGFGGGVGGGSGGGQPGFGTGFPN